MSSATLAREVARLAQRLPSRELAATADRLDFAARVGLPDPDPWQRDLLRSESKRVLLNCSRQAGKSSLAAVLALHQAVTVPGSLILLLAPTLRQSQELFQKVAASYAHLGNTVPADSERRLGLELANSSRIESLPGAERSIRGFSAPRLVILDEASRIPDELFSAVLPMLIVSGGRLMLLSTPFGRRGIFYNLWSGGEGWERYEVPATMVPRISEADLEAARLTMSAWEFNQEFLCSFEDSEASVFSTEDIQAALTDDVAPLFGGIA